MNNVTFEQARDDLQKLYQLLVHGEPTPDEETESKDKILQYLKVIQESPEGEHVKDLVHQAITLASGWDVYDLWFKEVKELPGIIDKILTTLKPTPAPASPALAEKSPEKVEPSVPAPAKAPEPPAPTSVGADLEAIVAKVADQFKSQIQELKGKISSLEKNLDEKDIEIEKGKRVNGKGAASSGVESTHLKPKLQVPKLKIPPVPASKPLPPRVEEKPAPAIPAPVEEAMPSQAVKPLAIKPIAIKPVIIAPSVVEKPAVAQPSIPKPVPVRQLIPKPVSIRPITVQPVEEPANLQPIPVTAPAARPIPKGISIKPISVKAVSIKPVSANVGPVEPPALSMEPEAPDNLQPITPRPISIKPISVSPGSPRPIMIKPVQAQPVSPAPISAQPVAFKPVSIQPVNVQQVSGSIRPVSVASAGPVVIKPISAQPVAIRAVSPGPSGSPGSNLASTLSSIGRTPQPAPESMIAVRPIAATASSNTSGMDLNATLPESKTDLYSELIALEGRRFATERRKKELDEQREKGQINQIEYQNSAGRADMDLQGIATRINSIRQKLSTL